MHKRLCLSWWKRIITQKITTTFLSSTIQVISSSLCPKIILAKVLQHLAQSKTTKNAIAKTCLRTGENGVQGEVDVWMLPQLPLTSRVVSLNRIVPSALEMDACKQTNKQTNKKFRTFWVLNCKSFKTTIFKMSHDYPACTSSIPACSFPRHTW